MFTLGEIWGPGEGAKFIWMKEAGRIEKASSVWRKQVLLSSSRWWQHVSRSSELVEEVRNLNFYMKSPLTILLLTSYTTCAWAPDLATIKLCIHAQLVPGVQLYPVFENQESWGLECSMGEAEDRGQLLPCGMLTWILPGLLVLIPAFLLWLQATAVLHLSLDSPSFCRLGVDVCYEHGHLSSSFTVLKPEGWAHLVGSGDVIQWQRKSKQFNKIFTSHVKNRVLI